jgi:hypothetical protein
MLTEEDIDRFVEEEEVKSSSEHSGRRSVRSRSDSQRSATRTRSLGSPMQRSPAHSNADVMNPLVSSQRQGTVGRGGEEQEKDDGRESRQAPDGDASRVQGGGDSNNKMNDDVALDV